MKIKTIKHVGVTVRNLEDSIKFYRDKLGFKLIAEPCVMNDDEEVAVAMGIPESKHRICMLEVAEGHFLELMEFGESVVRPVSLNIRGSHHIAYLVDDIREWVDRLTEQGVTFHSEPVLEQCETGDLLFVLLKDPDGTVIELIEERL